MPDEKFQIGLCDIAITTDKNSQPTYINYNGKLRTVDIIYLTQAKLLYTINIKQTKSESGLFLTNVLKS